jgi:hypothetical protein
MKILIFRAGVLCKSLLIIIAIGLQPQITFAQKHDNIWPMGYPGISSNNYLINFTDSFEIIPINLGANMAELANASICDSTGNLLFYTNGAKIIDSTHNLMQNGDNLNQILDSIAIYPNNFIYWDYGYPSKVMILPFKRNKYHIFHIERGRNGVLSFFALQLNHSIVDMSLNNGLGSVISKNKPLINDTIAGEGYMLEACKHANGQDWWILVPEYESNAYYRFLLSADSLYGPFSQEVGYSFSWIDYNGQAIFSPDGSLYVRYDPQNQAHLYDFNRCTGELSYRQQINVPSNINAGGAAISSNSRFLYIANDTIVFQYDLQAADINASRVTVAVYDVMSPFLYGFGQMQLAPNGKIYEISGEDRLHVIENPDSAGLACNFRKNAIITPSYNSISLPNFPHFRTPALPPGACDTTGLYTVQALKEEIKIYPNPSYNGSFKISLGGNYADLIQVQDLLGRLLLQEIWDTNEKEKELQLPSGAKGIYFVSIWKDGKLIKKEKMLLLD